MWLIYVLCSLIFFAGIEIFYKLYTERNPDVSSNAASFVTNLFMIFWALPFVIFSKSPLIFSEMPWPILIGENLIFVAGVALYYESYKVISASMGTILGMSSVLVTTLFGILFFNESITLSKFTGIGLIIFAITLLSFEKSKLHKKGYLYAFIGGLLFGTAYLIEKYIVTDYQLNIDHFQYLYALIALPLKVLLQPKTILRDIKRIKPRSLVYSAGAAFCIIIAYKFTLTAYTLGGEAGKIDAINNSAIL